MEDAPPPPLTPEEYRRYGRHLTLSEVGERGQRRLKAGSVLIVGAGGLGCPAALYLAAAGVGRITLIDFDVVDPSNLQRQILYGTDDVGHSKALRAVARLSALNPLLDIRGIDARIGADNVRELVEGHDVVVDGSDNFSTRYLVSDACVLAGRPYVYGSIFRFEGQASLFRPGKGPCYRCLFPEPPPEGLVPNCAQAGVLGVLPGLVGSLQALEALKVLVGLEPTLVGRLLLVDALGTSFREVRLARDPGCPLCCDSPTITTLEEMGRAACTAQGGVEGASPYGIAALELARALAGDDPPLLVDVREEWEFRAGALPDALHLPLGEVLVLMDQLPRDRAVVLYCRVGPRGERAAELLAGSGFDGVRNLTDGLVAWQEQVDGDQVVA